jgi:PAS domain S-box-containing protein
MRGRSLDGAQWRDRRRGSEDVAVEAASEARPHVGGSETRQELFDAIPCALVTADETGAIVGINAHAESLFGYARAELVGRSIEFLMPGVGPVLAEARTSADATPLQAASTLVEATARPRTGAEFPVAISLGRPIAGEDAVIPGVVLDLRERRASESRLRHACERAEAALKSVADTHMLIAWDWRYLYVNDAALQAIGRPHDEVIGQVIWELYPELIGTEIERQFRRAMADRVPARFEFWYAKADRCWELRLIPVPDGLAAFATNITDRKRAEESSRRSQDELRALSAHLETVREEERAHMSREIHDELGQLLTGLKIEVSLLQQRFHAHEGTAPVTSDAAFTRMSGMLDDSIHTVRRLATSLRPHILDELGLAAAIEWQVDDFLKSSGLACDVVLPESDVTLDRQTATALFRILQESLTNVVRHAHARRVSVRFGADRLAAFLEVADDGVGIGQPEPVGAPSFGLLSMKERAIMLGGQLDIRSRSGGGTTITVRVPRQPGSEKTASSERSRAPDRA